MLQCVAVCFCGSGRHVVVVVFVYYVMTLLQWPMMFLMHHPPYRSRSYFVLMIMYIALYDAASARSFGRNVIDTPTGRYCFMGILLHQ